MFLLSRPPRSSLHAHSPRGRFWDGRRLRALGRNFALVVAAIALGVQAGCGSRSGPATYPRVTDTVTLAAPPLAVPAEGAGTSAAPLARTAADIDAYLLPRDGRDEAVLREIRDFVACERRAHGLSPGDVASASYLSQSPQRLENLGLMPAGEGNAWVRRARLDGVHEMVPVGEQIAGGIDAIAILSIDRSGVDPPYLYATLASLFDTFPAGTRVNVFVGNERTDYVDAPRLSAALGAARAAQVQVIGVERPEGEMLAEMTLYRRQTWNYARVLRSYQGSRGLLVLEDDVVWARDGASRLQALLREDPTPIASLFNIRCVEPAPGAHRSLGVSWARPDMARFAFTYFQAMRYGPEEAFLLGAWLRMHMHERSSDLNASDLMRALRWPLSFPYPSLVQHIGGKSTGLGDHFPETKCFFDDLVPL